MNEIDPFIKHVQQRVNLSPEEMTELTDAFQLKKIKKKQFIIQPDFIARHRTYVVEGAMRSYVIDQDGVDHTIQFAVETYNTDRDHA